MSTASEAGVGARSRGGDVSDASGAGDVVEGVWLSQPDPVGAWLDVLMGLVRLGGAEKRGIRDELDSHLRDRVRDLMLTGLREQIATREAIAELGDAAELAARYARASKSPARRRIAMNLGLFGMAGAALVTSFVAMQQPGGSGGSGAGGQGQRQPAGMSVYPGAGSGDEAVQVGSVRVEGMPLEELLRQVAKSVDKRLLVDWLSLGELGLESVTPVRLDVPDTDLASLFEALRSVSEVDPRIGRLEYRVDDTTFRVASRYAFDLAERVIVTIDLTEAQELGVGEEEIVALVTAFIEPDQWTVNGGDVATMSIVGTKLFVKAPPRIIEGVRWIVGQFAAPASAKVTGGEGSAASGMRRYPLQHTSVAEMASVIGHALNVAPSLRQSSVDRKLGADPSTNTLMVYATGAELEWVAGLVKELDGAGPTADRAVTETRTIRLRLARAAEVREFLGRALEVNPMLKECLVARVFEVDASDNTLSVSATPGQTDTILRIASMLDAQPLDR